MAINWLLALKAVPWGELVQAAPTIVKGARKLYTTVRGGSGEASAPTNAAGRAAGPAAGADARLALLEDRVAALAAEQQAGAEVIRNLAEQNARMIEAMGIMRARARILFGALIVSWIATIVLAVWVATR